MYEMREEHKTGNREIDRAHKKLYEIADDAYLLLHDEQVEMKDKSRQLADMMENLKDCAVKHFAEEEAYLKEIGYKKIFTQIIEHNECSERLEEFIRNDNGDNRRETVEAILDYFTDWLDRHIGDVDIMFGKWI